jgi:excisionase family DNA binding protein
VKTRYDTAKNKLKPICPGSRAGHSSMNSTIYSQIGLRVRQLRRQQHHSQDELSVWLRAFHAPITRDMIANWETGQAVVPAVFYSSAGLRAQGRGDGYSAPPDLKGFEGRPDHARVPPPARAATNPSISHHHRMNVTAQHTAFSQLETQSTEERSMKTQSTETVVLGSSQIPAGERYLSKMEVAARLGMTARTVEHWMRRGIIPYVKIGKGRRATVLFKWAEIEVHLKKYFGVGFDVV